MDWWTQSNPSTMIQPNLVSMESLARAVVKSKDAQLLELCLCGFMKICMLAHRSLRGWCGTLQWSPWWTRCAAAASWTRARWCRPACWRQVRSKKYSETGTCINTECSSRSELDARTLVPAFLLTVGEYKQALTS